MIFRTTNSQLVKAFRFANRCVETNEREYARRGQRNTDRIIQQIGTGKLAEEAAREFVPYVFDCGEVSRVDYEVYGKRQKSFDADLTTASGLRVHVKSCERESAEKWGMSWVFQKRDEIVSMPDTDDVLVLCVVDNDVRTVEIKWCFRAQDALGHYEPLASKRLRRTKVALYDTTLAANTDLMRY